MNKDLDQFNTFLSENNFHLALKRLQTAPRTFYKNLYYQDLKIFSLFARENICTLLNEIEQGIYKPDCSYRFFIPKKSNLVRPLSLLKFRDILVYQAVINVISDVVYDDICPYHNNFIFGSCYNNSSAPEKERIFFLKKWTDQWKAFENKTRNYYESGYSYLSEFDIASFFDTIDHFILAEILKNKHSVDNELANLLTDLLASWTGDFTGKTLNGRHGIPQGPIASSFLADVYLFHLDREILENRILDVKYIRYVDDIRVFSKTEKAAKKAIAYLDLFARDLGLIPQGSKILMNKIDDIESLLRHQKSKFSQIKREHQKKGFLKNKTQKRLKKRFLNCFLEGSEEVYLDKTLIKFSLYKLNKDEEVKATILGNWENLQLHLEDALFYLSNHFNSDLEVRDFLKNILTDESLLFYHASALIFNYFPDIEYIESLYRRYIKSNNRHWLVQYYMVQWLQNNRKGEIFSQIRTENYFLARELNTFIYSNIKDRDVAKYFCEDLMCSQDCMLALQGLYFNPMTLVSDDLDLSQANSYILKIKKSGFREDYIGYILKSEYGIVNPENFFNEVIWDQENTYSELILSFRKFHSFVTLDASISLLSLNIFNNLVFDKLCIILKVQQPSKEFGVNLDSGCIKSDFPVSNQYFKDINAERNQRTEAHPYDKYGNLRVRINVNELKKLISKQIKALKEICDREYI